MELFGAKNFGAILSLVPAKKLFFVWSGGSDSDGGGGEVVKCSSGLITIMPAGGRTAGGGTLLLLSVAEVLFRLLVKSWLLVKLSLLLL